MWPRDGKLHQVATTRNAGAGVMGYLILAPVDALREVSIIVLAAVLGITTVTNIAFATLC